MHVKTVDYADDDDALIAEFIRLRQQVITQAARIRMLEQALADAVRRGGISLRDVLPETMEP